MDEYGGCSILVVERMFAQPDILSTDQDMGTTRSTCQMKLTIPAACLPRLSLNLSNCTDGTDAIEAVKQ
jgi:hypothetical protein